MHGRVLTILGTSLSLRDDIQRCGVVGDVMAVNRTIVDYMLPIRYAVSVHPNLLHLFMEWRKFARLDVHGVEWHSNLMLCPLAVNTSGLFALWLAAEHLGYGEIRVLGMAADGTGHYYDITPGMRHDDFAERFPFDNPAWVEVMGKWRGVRVASGNLTSIFPRL